MSARRLAPHPAPNPTAREVDRLYRELPDPETLWLTQSSWDDAPRQRRPHDELPGRVTDYLTLMEALERLTRTQRLVFRAIVMGVVRTYDFHGGQYVDVKVKPMTYAECALFMDLTEGAVSQSLFRARQRLAKLLSDGGES